MKWLNLGSFFLYSEHFIQSVAQLPFASETFYEFLMILVVRDRVIGSW